MYHKQYIKLFMRAVCISISGIDLHLFQRKPKTLTFLAKHFFLAYPMDTTLYEQPELDHLRYTLSKNTLVGFCGLPHA